jgi:hypothetical protein
VEPALRLDELMINLMHNFWTNNSHLQQLRRLNHQAIHSRLYRRSARVAFVVGTLLNLINQPKALLELVLFDFIAMDPINVVKIALTYAVPFFVATYGALSTLPSSAGAKPDR